MSKDIMEVDDVVREGNLKHMNTDYTTGCSNYVYIFKDKKYIVSMEGFEDD